MKIRPLKWLSSFAILAICGCAVGSPIGASADEFVFERYRDEDTTELKAFLLARHPIGSNVEPLVKRLQNSGAFCGPSRDKTHPKGVACTYYAREFFLERKWSIMIDFTETENLRNIKSIGAWSWVKFL